MKKRIIIGCLLLTIGLTLGMLLLISSMNGKVVTTGQNPANIQGSSLVCTTDQTYPIATYDSARKRNLKITVGFYDDEIDSISLAYELFYDEPEKIVASEAHNHAAMNTAFGEDGLGADAYNATYAKLDDRMRLSLYIKSDNIDRAAAKYFMIDVENDANLPRTLTEYQKNYRYQGFNCESNNS